MQPPPSDLITIVESSADAIVGLRTRVLRPNFPPGKLAAYPEDPHPTTSHWAATLDGQIVGCATFHLDPCPHTPDEQALRLRGMAVAPEHQNKNIGAILMRHAIAQLDLRHADLPILWCNARLRAVTFYERLGFERWGELFEIEGIGPHYVMSRPLRDLA